MSITSGLISEKNLKKLKNIFRVIKIFNKKYKILIRLVVIRRDYSTYGLIKSCLESLGCKVLIVSSNNFTLALRLWKPHAVITHTLNSEKRLSRYYLQ